MTTIQQVLEGPSEPWGDKNDMTTWKVRADDGTEGVVFRKTSSPALEPGMTLEPNGSTKNGDKKFKVVQPGYSGGGSAGSSQKGSAEFRSPEQIMRSTALECSVATGATSVKDAIARAQEFAIYIAVGGVIEPKSAAASTDEIPL